MIVHTWNSSPLRSNVFRLKCTCCTVLTTSERPHGSPLVWVCQWPSSQPLSSPQLSHNDSFWASRITKSHRDQRLGYREGEKLSWCPFWSNSLWQGWSCGLVHCPGGNATEMIWRVMASSLGISFGTPIKPQHSSLTLTLWPINSGVLTSLLLPHLSSSLADSLPSLNLLCHSKTVCSNHARWSKSSLKHFIRFCGIFSKFKTEFIAYRSSQVSDCIFEIYQLWQSGFSRVCFNSCCSCSFEPEIIKIGQSSHKMYSNNILHFQESTSILNAHTKKSLETYRMHLVYMYIYLQEKLKIGHFRIINLFPSCLEHWYESITHKIFLAKLLQIKHWGNEYNLNRSGLRREVGEGLLLFKITSVFFLFRLRSKQTN